MIVFPAIDILGGKVVRLEQGRYDRVTTYRDDPLSQALEFAEQGASWVHMVDLDGARDGRPANLHIIERIASDAGLEVQVGGGIRELDTIKRLQSAGASRFVLGTSLVRDPAFVREAVELYGDGIVAGVDARDGQVQIEGWHEGAEVNSAELVAELAGLGLRHLVYTDISRDGMRTGISAGAYRSVAEAAGFPVIVSGGVSSLDDVREARALGPDIVEGIIVGRAVYEQVFSVEEALAVARLG